MLKKILATIAAVAMLLANVWGWPTWTTAIFGLIVIGLVFSLRDNDK
ncbi:hypothetical protein [Corynebacterium sp.]|nr:hypothetical protein [Corynebacterium sp.]MDO5032627.1 hypothetical protein [Corynebacterium sp.]